MTNETIPNVPRELLERCCKRMYDMMQGDLHEELRTLLSAAQPSADGEREQFELYAAMKKLDIGMFTPPSLKEYRDPQTQSDWEAWQARAALPAKAEGVLVEALKRAALAMWNSESNMDNEAADAEEALFNYYLYEKSE